MAVATGNRGGGQRSKGDRSFVGTRVPRDQSEVLPRVAKLKGWKTVSEYVAALIEADLRETDLSSLEMQESLPLDIQERVSMPRRLAS